MSVNIKLIRTKYPDKMPITEVLSFAVSKQALLDIASQIKQPGEYEVRVDSRESDAVVSMIDTDQVDQMLAIHSPLPESKMTLVTSVKDTKRAASLEPITWLGDPQAVVAAIDIK